MSRFDEDRIANVALNTDLNDLIGQRLARADVRRRSLPSPGLRRFLVGPAGCRGAGASLSRGADRH